VRLSNKVAVVTGAQKGIGAAIAITFAREGAHVIVNWLDDEAAADEVVATIDQAGGSATKIRADVRHTQDVKALFAAAESHGGADILVNNAGMFPRVDLLSMTEADWDYVHDINLKGPWRCLQQAAQQFVAHDKPGVVLNMTSVAFWTGSELGVHYAATKGGLIGLTRAAARDLAKHKVRVNALAPGLTDTDQPRDGMSEAEIAAAGGAIPLGRISAPADIADAALFLCCNESRHITGQTLHVNGGQVFY
jgi:NAD(P)-dependent dehydrogenase (short-subunit alcohol dehydrogenase family)